MTKNKDASADFTGAFYASMRQDFSSILEQESAVAVAVAVSGGADSVSLCFSLSDYLAKNFPNVTLHAITVDHGLRAEAAEEAEYVGSLFSVLPNIKHSVLKWEHIEKPSARIQEEARKARYDLMFSYMQENGIRHLFLGHHLDDQAETFLFRLSKGSGLDGLACMMPMQEMEEGAIILCRPLLSIPKDDLIAYCQAQDIEFVNDPSNDDPKYARVRLRGAMDVLAAEGLSAARLGRTAMRLSRARGALEWFSGKAYDECAIEIKSNRIVFNFDLLRKQPDEIILRVILQALSDLSPQRDYGVRMERAEDLCADLLKQEKFRKRTLGGVIFTRDDARGALVMDVEQVV